MNAIMDAWRKWSQEQWDKWGSKLQNKYDKIRDTETPLWYRQLTEKLWDALDDSAKMFLNNFVKEALAKFDENFARELVEKIIGSFRKRFVA